MPKFIVLLFLLFSSSVLFAQQGHHFMSNYQHEFENIDNHNADILQNNDGILYFANRKGILKFDGGHWELITTPVSAYALALSQSGDSTFVGGKHKIGFISKNKEGKEVYQSLGDSLYLGQDFRVVKRVGDKVYFFSEEILIEYSSSKNEISQEWHNSSLEGDLEISSFFTFGDEAFLELSEDGIYKIKGKKLIATNLSLPNDEQILFSRHIPQLKKTLLGSVEGNLFWFNGRTIRPFRVEEQDFLEKSQVIDVVFLNRELLAFATLRSGCILLNPRTGKTIDIINYQTGLADNEIFAISTDKYNGVWLTHEYGFTRLDHNLPFKDFSTYQGLEGHILGIKYFADALYVGTSSGVFFLEEIKDYEEYAYIVQESIDVRASLTSRQSTISRKSTNTSFQHTNVIVTRPTILDNDTQSKKPLNKLERKRLRKAKRQKRREDKRKKRSDEGEGQNTQNIELEKEERTSIDTNKDSVELIDSNKTENQITTGTQVAQVLPKNKKQEIKSTKKKLVKRRLIRKKNKSFSDVKRYLALKSVKYLFKKIKGIDGKCKQLLVVDEHLFVASNTGLYTIKDKKVRKLSSTATHFIYKPSKDKGVYASTNDNTLLVLTLDRKKWKVNQTIGEFKDRISRISEDEYSNLWVCGTDYIYQLFKNQEGVVDSTSDFSISNPYEDEVLPYKTSGRLYFILSGKAYYYNQKQNTFSLDDGLVKLLGSQGNFLSHNENFLWTYTGKESWRVFGDYNYDSKNFIFLNIINNIEKIIPNNDDKTIWILTKNNNLYHFNTEKTVLTKHKYNLVLDYVKDKQGDLLPLDGLQLKYDNRNLSFHFTTPKYFENKNVEYQYKLLGKMKEWTEWTKGGTFIFSALNSGKYRLKVRSRDTFGHFEESKIYSFRILPPYWRSSLFYGLEILIFGILVFFTAILNRRTQHHNKLFIVIRQTLTILTLIMCVEFIKVVLESYVSISGSPVIDFGMEVAFALLIFPFERFFSRTVFKATIHTGGKNKRI